MELAVQQQLQVHPSTPHAYLVLLGITAEKHSMPLAELLRDHGLRVECNCGGGSLKSQMKRADRSGAAYALLLGEAEVLADSVSLKYLRAEEPQARMSALEAATHIKQRLDIGQ